MNFEVNIEKIIDYELTFNQYLFLQFVYQQEYSLFQIYLSQKDKFFSKDDLDYLINQGYLEMENKTLGYRFGNLKVANKFINQFIDKPAVSKINGIKVEDWIDEWYELFPKGVKTMGYLVRSDKNGCIKKMTNFINNNPEFTREIIIRATKDYINYYRLHNWQGIQCAHYYISKNNISNLASGCENIKERIEEGEITDLEIDYTIDRFSKTLNTN